MAEAEWAEFRSLWPLLLHLKKRASDRKLRLLGVGCCRQVWDQIQPLRCRRAVETSERFADGLATPAEMHRARELGYNSAAKAIKIDERGIRYLGAVGATLSFAAETANPESPFPRHGFNCSRENEVPDYVKVAPELIRCLFGPRPVFHPTYDPEWKTPQVSTLAQTTYEDRNFELMPILGDALEEAGCGNPEVLRHCREGGLHVRGCWVVDLILGKS